MYSAFTKSLWFKPFYFNFVRNVFKMIRRTTAIYHVLVVSILLLAHAVIPHIHFNSEIIITGSESHANKQNCNSNQHKHSEEEDAEADFCLLKQVYLARTNDTDSDDSEQDWLFHQNDFPNVFYALLNSDEISCFTQPAIAINRTYFDSIYGFLGYGNVNSRGSPQV